MMATALGRTAIRCPPEYLLRMCARRANNVGRHQSSAGIICQRQCSGTATYRAAVCTELGRPLVLQNIPRPKLESGDVRVAVHSAGVNFADILMIQGKYQEKKEVPFVPGSELAGEVLEVAADVTDLEPGDRVVGLAPLTGSFTQETTVNSSSLHKIPDSLEFSDAAALLISYGTAYLALKHRANIQPGETVLVTAAAGGVGLAAVDLAANVFKAKVIAACGGPEKCAIAKEKGAFEAIDYNSESLRDRVKEITDGDGADIILDAVGGKTFNQCLRSLAFEGRLVVIGFASGEIPRAPANIMLLKSCSVMGVYWGSYQFRSPAVFTECVSSVLDHAAVGRIKPHISWQPGMHEVNEALQFVTDRKSTGKVVLDVRYSIEQ